MSQASLAGVAETLRTLHRPGRPVVLPNAWDAATARLVEAAGFAAVATSSAAVVESLGWVDDGTAPPDEVFAAIGRISRAVSVPVTADLEDGYGLPPVDLVERLLGAGAVGCNLEDTDHRAGHGALVDPGQQADRIAAVKDAGRRAGVDLIVNARIDVHFQQAGPVEQRLPAALDRARRYLAAGADCVYPIGVNDEGVIAAFVQATGARVNVGVPVRDPPIARLAALGVARISFGPGFASAALDSMRGLLGQLADRVRSIDRAGTAG